MAIKRDVVYKDDIVHNERDVDRPNEIDHDDNEESSVVESVDDIFADADRIMFEQSKSLSFTPKQPKKRRRPILKLLICMLLVIVLILTGSVFAIVKFAKEEYQSFKETFLIQVGEFQEQLNELDDSQLSVDEYYLKRALLLFTADEIGLILQDAEQIDGFPMVLLKLDESNLDLIPVEKREAYQALMEEYYAAIADRVETEE